MRTTLLLALLKVRQPRKGMAWNPASTQCSVCTQHLSTVPCRRCFLSCVLYMYFSACWLGTELRRLKAPVLLNVLKVHSLWLDGFRFQHVSSFSFFSSLPHLSFVVSSRLVRRCCRHPTLSCRLPYLFQHGYVKELTLAICCCKTKCFTDIT